MRFNFFATVIVLILCLHTVNAQITGGGATYASAVTFNQSWLVGCPSGGTALCNTSVCEPATAMDACGAAPACATGTTGSDIWFKFFAQSSTATITVNPTSAFDIAIQAFSGSSCAGLVAIGCADVQGNNQTETLTLTGLVSGTIYHFRIFGATNSISARTGNYNFCGTSGLGSAPLPLTLINAGLELNNQTPCIKWTVENEIDIDSYDIEYSLNGWEYTKAGTALSLNQVSLHEYTFCDAVRRNNGVYRIKINEISGKISYSSVLRYKSFTDKNIILFPNPAAHQLYLELPADIPLTTQIRYQISSMAGQVVKRGTFSTDRSIRIQQLLPGNYILQIMYFEKTESFRFNKK